MSSFPKFCAGVFSIAFVAACGSNSSLGAQPVLTGQIDGWTRGAGFTLQASLITMSASAPPLATAAIDDAGNFSIALPGPSALASYLTPQHFDVNQPTPGCTGTNLQVSPQDFATVVLSLKATSGTLQLPVSQKVAPSTSIVYVYVDRDLNETGRLDCTFGTLKIQETVDIHFGLGWNAEVNVTQGSSTNATSSPIPSGAKWVTP